MLNEWVVKRGIRWQCNKSHPSRDMYYDNTNFLQISQLHGYHPEKNTKPRRFGEEN